MEKLTKQKIRDLNYIAGRKHLNGRRDKGSNECFHIFQDYTDDNYRPFKRCQRCQYEE